MQTSAAPVIQWQRDLSQFVFLGNAIERVGKHVFGNEWLGTEQSVQIPAPLPSFDDSTSQNSIRSRLEAHQILSAIPEYISCPISLRLPASFAAATPSINRVTDYHFSRESWEKASEIRKHEIEDLTPLGMRLGTVRSKLIDAFIGGQIRTGLRPKQAFTIEVLEPDVWGIVNLNNVFGSYQIDPRNPVSIYFCGDAFQWVYVSKEDLEALIDNESKDCMQPGSGCGIQAPDVSLTPLVVLSSRKRGPKATKGPAIQAKMREITPEALGSMKEEEMAAMFKASRDVCRKARDAVLLESPTISDK